MQRRSSDRVGRLPHAAHDGVAPALLGDSELDASIATVLLSALELAREHGGAAAALEVAGIALPDVDRFAGLADELEALLGRPIADTAVSGALALGFLAGRVPHRPRARRLHDPTSFVIDRELVVQAAQGESIMRLPWFDDGLFVGRQLPDISEMPVPIRRVAIESYTAALAGTRGRFTFSSYGHFYAVDAVPVHGEDRRIEAVLAIATPARSFTSAARAYERTAERLDRSATQAEQRAERHRLEDRDEAEVAERQAAGRAREAACRARASARRLRSRDSVTATADPPAITPRETDVLSLASHGLTQGEIAEQLAVTVATVKTHFENIYPKLGVSDKAAAVAVALRHGLIE